MIDGDFYDDTPWPGVSATEGEPSTRESHARPGATGQRAGTVDQLWEMRIAAGECPRGMCSGALDGDGYCSLCGFSLLSHRMRTRVAVREQPADHLPTYPGALRLDEYAPADMTEEAA